MFKFLAIKLYNLLFILAIPLIIIRLLIKSIKLPAYRYRMLERFGIFTRTSPNSKPTYIWIHAVSVGEIMAATPIIQELNQKLPQFSIMLTCTTPRGSEIIQQKLANLVDHVYLPLDFSFAIKNFLKKVKPKILILIEKEIWPNIILSCYQYNIPVIIANAQLSNKSFIKFLKFKFLFSTVINKIFYILTQTKFDAYKFKQIIKSKSYPNIIIKDNTKLDVNKFKQIITSKSYPNIIVNGNTKFDILNNNVPTNNNNFCAPKSIGSRPIWIAASTHAGEEQIIIKAHQIILKSIPNALLILVPRHPERVKLIIKDLPKECISFISFSTQPDFKLIDPKYSIYMVDVIGQLNTLYQISQATFVGGSLIPGIGGHNVLEPAALSLPITVGSYTENFQEIIYKLKLQQGIIIVKNTEQLANIIIKWLLDPNARDFIGKNARNYLIQQQGATKRIINLIKTLI